MVESSIVLPFSGGSGRGPIFDGKTRHFGDPGPHFPIVLRIPAENDDFARDVSQNITGRHGILDRATGPPKELVLIYILVLIIPGAC